MAKVSIVMGSDSDMPVMAQAADLSLIHISAMWGPLWEPPIRK